MGWENVEEWPSNTTSGVYRGAAEIIVAERAGLTFLERIVLWWHSTTELPFADVAQDVVVTPNYVYVRKQDGTKMRVRRDALVQGRALGRRRQYSVPNGTDMVLSDRNGDDVERALMSEEEVKGWTRPARWFLTLGFMAAAIGLAVVTSEAYINEGAGAVADGRYNSESAYWFYACIGLWAVPVILFFVAPHRLIVDAIGLRSVRGFPGGLRSTIPIEDIRFVDVKHFRYRGNGATVHVYSVYAHTTKKRQKVIKLREFRNLGRNRAIEFAQLCAKTWNVEAKIPKERR